MCDSKQKSSYKHVSDFGRLRSYDRFFNSRTRPRVNHISQLAGSRTPLAYLETFVECVKVEGGVGIHLAHAQFTTERQPVLRPAVAFSKTSFKHRSVQIKGNFTKLTLQL